QRASRPAGARKSCKAPMAGCKREDAVIARFTHPNRGFPVFSLFGSVIFGRIPGFTGPFAAFSNSAPPFTGIYRRRWVSAPLDCIPSLRHETRNLLGPQSLSLRPPLGAHRGARSSFRKGPCCCVQVRSSVLL